MSKYRIGRAMALITIAAVGLLYAQLWHNVTPSYNGLAFGGGTFVAVSGDGVIRTSTNGTDWTQRFGVTGDMRSLLSVGWGDGVFFITQTGTGLLRSEDGFGWRVENTSITHPCRSLTYGAGILMGVGDDGGGDPMVFHRDDEEVWHSAYAPFATTNLARIAFGADRYVAVGSNIIHSTVLSAGRTWTPAGMSTPGGLGAIAFGDDTFAALSNNGQTVYTSADGATWTSAPAGVPEGMADMTYGNGRFVAVGAGGRAAWSTNGSVWTPVAAPLNAGDNFIAVRYGDAGGGMFVALGARGSVYTSPDGAVWSRQSGGRLMTYRQIVKGGDKFVAVGDSGVAVSSDGRDWSGRTAGRRLQAVAYGGGRFVAVGDSGARFSSADGGETWTDHSLTGIDREIMLTSIAFGDGVFIAGGRTPVGSVIGGAAVYTSANGQTWTELPDIANWSAGVHPVSMAYGNNRFVAAGSTNGMMRYSDSGSTQPGRYWNTITLTGATSHRIVQVVYSGNRFVALGVISGGGGSILLTSTDGISWQTTQAPASAKSVTFAKNHYVLAADSGSIYASSNGSQWNVLRKGTNRNLTTIYYDGENTLYAAGVAGAMLFSVEDPIPVSVLPRPASSRPAGKWGMTIDNSHKAPKVTLSFTPEKQGTLAVYSLKGKQILKMNVNAGQRSIQLPGRLTSSGTVIVRYVGNDGRTVSQRFQMVR